MCQWIGVKLVWAISNFIVFACMAGTAIISLVSVREYSEGIQHVIGGNGVTKIASLVVFALLGVPLSVSIPVLVAKTAPLFMLHHCFPRSISYVSTNSSHNLKLLPKLLPHVLSLSFSLTVVLHDADYVQCSLLCYSGVDC